MNTIICPNCHSEIIKIKDSKKKTETQCLFCKIKFIVNKKDKK